MLDGEGADDMTLPAEVCETRSRKSAVGLFGSFTAQLNNGINLSLSTYGPTGQPSTGKYFLSIFTISTKAFFHTYNIE